MPSNKTIGVGKIIPLAISLSNVYSNKLQDR
jgi:hypothetical protein